MNQKQVRPTTSPSFCVTIETRSSAQGNCSAKSLAGYVVDSSLSSLPSLWGSGGGGGLVGERGWGRGRRGGRGYFIHLAIYCTTTWCFALKGLRTTNNRKVCYQIHTSVFSSRFGQLEQTSLKPRSQPAGSQSNLTSCVRWLLVSLPRSTTADSKGVFPLGNTRSFFGLTSKITPLSSMLKF